MKGRYKTTKSECDVSTLNIHSLNEVLTGDDSAYFSDLEVWLPEKKEWKCLLQALRDRDVITDNYNTILLFPRNSEERDRGYAY